jgi:hypothetical protein
MKAYGGVSGCIDTRFLYLDTSLEMSGELHAQAVSPQEEELPVHIGEEAG